MPVPSHVIVVEDNPPLRRLLERELRRRGVGVSAARSCKDANQVTGSFDVGVFDMHLGDGSGIELAARMVSDGRVRRVVFFTAGATRSERKAASLQGRVISKSAGVQAVLRAIFGGCGHDGGP